MKSVNCLLLLLLFWTAKAGAQSYHFSQFYTTPLLHNPAFTGYTQGPFRVAANFRSQWLQGGTPYLTGALSADVSPLRGKLPQGNKAGLGMLLLSDQSLGGALQTNMAGISAAYSLALDPEDMHHIGAGLQATFQEQRIDYSRITFENQFTGDGFDISMPVGEVLNVQSKRYLDAHAGLLYHYTFEATSFFLSAGGYNLLQRRQTLTNGTFRMPVRYSLLAGGQVASGYSGSLYYSLNHMQQGGAKATTLGAAYGVLFGSESNQELQMGLWYRVNDAFIPYVGLRLDALQVGLSFDYTTGREKTSASVRNAFELSLVYLAKDRSEMKRLIPWY